MSKSRYMYKGGEKLAFALEHFGVSVDRLTMADLGCNVGGFTDCLLQNGAAKVYSVDTGYGILAWKLRNDNRVEVFERTNAMHWKPDEPLDGAVIDVGWTRQEKIIPHTFNSIVPGGFILSLFKPQYEADKRDLVKGILPEEKIEPLLEEKLGELKNAGYPAQDYIKSRLKGGTKGKGNTEYFIYFSIGGKINESNQ